MIIQKYFYFVIFIHIDVDKSHFDDVIQFMFSSSIPLPFFIFLECYKIFRARKYARERCSVRNPSLMELNEIVSMNLTFLFFVTVTISMKICLVDELKFYKF